MLQCSYMLDKKDYMREYRKKNRERLNAYQREYFEDEENKEKHKKACAKYRKHNMKESTRQKIKAYQHEYYLKRKAAKK